MGVTFSMSPARCIHFGRLIGGPPRCHKGSESHSACCVAASVRCTRVWPLSSAGSMQRHERSCMALSFFIYEISIAFWGKQVYGGWTALMLAEFGWKALT